MQRTVDYSGMASGAVQAALEVIAEEAERRLELKTFLEHGNETLALMAAADLVGAKLEDIWEGIDLAEECWPVSEDERP